MVGFLKETENDMSTLEADSSGVITWYMDESLAVHEDMERHMSGIISLGHRVVQTVSTKQKVNTRKLHRGGASGN
jgi:hypothetical protein